MGQFETLISFTIPRVICHTRPMPKRSSSDPSEIAGRIVRETTGDATSEERIQAELVKLKQRLSDEELRKLAGAILGSKGGQKGGKARAKTLTPEQRSDIARTAAEARWKKKSD